MDDLDVVAATMQKELEEVGYNIPIQAVVLALLKALNKGRDGESFVLQVP